jgi:hypothetical protein
MVEGESGPLAIGPPQERPHYEPTKRRLTRIVCGARCAVSSNRSLSIASSSRGPRLALSPASSRYRAMTAENGQIIADIASDEAFILFDFATLKKVAAQRAGSDAGFA